MPELLPRVCWRSGMRLWKSSGKWIKRRSGAMPHCWLALAKSAWRCFAIHLGLGLRLSSSIFWQTMCRCMPLCRTSVAFWLMISALLSVILIRMGSFWLILRMTVLRLRWTAICSFTSLSLPLLNCWTGERLRLRHSGLTTATLFPSGCWIYPGWRWMQVLCSSTTCRLKNCVTSGIARLQHRNRHQPPHQKRRQRRFLRPLLSTRIVIRCMQAWRFQQFWKSFWPIKIRVISS